jgi:hypothetical protein
MKNRQIMEEKKKIRNKQKKKEKDDGDLCAITKK